MPLESDSNEAKSDTNKAIVAARRDGDMYGNSHEYAAPKTRAAYADGSRSEVETHICRMVREPNAVLYAVGIGRVEG